MRHNFKKLKIWIMSMDFVDRVYDYCDTLPDTERYGLRSQLTRSAVSIPSNIAEGSAKPSSADFVRFLNIALGSAYEAETQLLICQRRMYGDGTKRQIALEGLPGLQKSIRSFRHYLQSPTG